MMKSFAYRLVNVFAREGRLTGNPLCVFEDGTGLERITTYPGFDAFPMFSSDGKRLVWASNRNGTVEHETNIFIADWVE